MWSDATPGWPMGYLFVVPYNTGWPIKHCPHPHQVGQWGTYLWSHATPVSQSSIVPIPIRLANGVAFCGSMQHRLANGVPICGPIQHWLANGVFICGPIQHWLANQALSPSPSGRPMGYPFVVPYNTGWPMGYLFVVLYDTG